MVFIFVYKSNQKKRVVKNNKLTPAFYTSKEAFEYYSKELNSSPYVEILYVNKSYRK